VAAGGGGCYATGIKACPQEWPGHTDSGLLTSA